MKVLKVVGIVFLVLVLTITGFYFTQINNIFAVKADIEKPEIDLNFIEENPGVQVIGEEHLAYLANELGTYKLHSSSGENAVLVFEMTDINIKFALVINGELYITQDIPEVVDLIIRGKQLIIARLIDSDNLVSLLQEELQSGNIKIELISDETTLAMKGYLAIYESLV